MQAANDDPANLILTVYDIIYLLSVDNDDETQKQYATTAVYSVETEDTCTIFKSVSAHPTIRGRFTVAITP
jgi:hypothetical protein